MGGPRAYPPGAGDDCEAVLADLGHVAKMGCSRAAGSALLCGDAGRLTACKL